MISIKRHLNICNFYILLWIIYVQQGLLYESGGIISKSVLLIALLISIANFISVHKSYPLPVYFKGLDVLLAMFTIYGLFLMLLNTGSISAEEVELSSFNYLKRIYSSLLPTYSIYLYTKQGKLDRSTLIFWIIVFFFSAYGEYIYSAQQKLEYLASIGSMKDEFTNNTGYIFLALFPSLYMLKKTWVRYVGLTIIIIMALLCMKRGAILGVSIATSIFIFNTFKSAKSSFKIAVFLVSIVCIFVVGSYVQELMVNSDYFMLRLNNTLSGDSSGRDVMYEKLWNHFLNDSNILQILLGNGAYSTINILGNLAHNDWLEILTCQGILGICIFIYFWLCFWRNVTRLPSNSECRLIIGMCLFVVFFKTLLSMSYDDVPIYLSVVLGYALANADDLTTQQYDTVS